MFYVYNTACLFFIWSSQMWIHILTHRISSPRKVLSFFENQIFNRLKNNGTRWPYESLLTYCSNNIIYTKVVQSKFYFPNYSGRTKANTTFILCNLFWTCKKSALLIERGQQQNIKKTSFSLHQNIKRNFQFIGCFCNSSKAHCFFGPKLTKKNWKSSLMC